MAIPLTLGETVSVGGKPALGSRLDPALSAYLDILRIAAALTVFLVHCALFWRPEAFQTLTPVAHGTVVVFFVLSGYVVAYATASKKRDLKHYIAARLSRLYSVVAPALILTAAVEGIGRLLNPHFYERFSRGLETVRYLATAFFLQNVWHQSAAPRTNGPFWSLSYEFWYYVIFGAAVFARGWVRKVALAAAVMLIAGPNILLLLPCWLLGVGLYYWRERLRLPRSGAFAVFAVAFLALMIAIVRLPEYPFPAGSAAFWYSSAFVSDWILALVVGLTIAAFDAMRCPPPARAIATAIRHCADHTFSLYLYHFPLLAFATAIAKTDVWPWWKAAIAGSSVLAIVVALGLITEGLRPRWQRLFERVLQADARAGEGRNGGR